LIEVKDLVKDYGGHPAVRGISFTIEPGHIYGFLGPNGAGKSTTMNIMTGCLAATSGQVLINGHDIVSEPVEAKRGVGYLPEQPPLYPDMTPREYLKFVGSMKGLKGKELETQVEDAMEKTDLTEEYADRLIKNLSKGYRQRVGIAQAVLGDPKLIILDEPTVGLDPAQIVEIRELISLLGKEHTVVLSSHILSEVSAVCDHILIISRGKLVAQGATEDILAMFRGGAATRLKLEGDGEAAAAALRTLEGVEEVTAGQDGEGLWAVEVRCGDGTDLRRAIFTAVVGTGCAILEMTSDTVSLEDVFMELTSQEDDDENGEDDDADAEEEAEA